MKILPLILITFLAGCASSKNNEYDIVIPLAESNKIKPQQTEKSSGSFKIHYKKDINNNPIVKTLNRSTTVMGNDEETIKSLRERAKKEIVQLATEEVNGVVIASTSKTNTTVINVDSNKSNTRYSRQDFSEKAVAQTAGIAQVKNLQCQTLPTKASNLTVTCSADVTVHLIENIDFTQ